MTDKPADLSKLNYATHPNLSRLVEQHVKDFPNGMVASGLEEGIQNLAAPTRQFYFVHAIDHFKAYVDRGFQDVCERIAALEAKPTLRDAGVWRADELYQAGDVTTHGGSAWVARRVGTGQRPGEPGDYWRLMVKRGRDGKDVK